MRYKKIFAIQIFILLIFLLIACQNRTGGEPALETAIETREKWFMENTETSMWTIESVEIPDTITSMAEETVDSDEFTWLDQALADCLAKKPEELMGEDYQAVTELGIHDRDNDAKEVSITLSGKSGIRWEIVPLTNLSVPIIIDMDDIVKCKNINVLSISCSDALIIHYEALIQLQQLTCLRMEPPEETIQNTIDDFSFICQMPNLTIIAVENMELPDDLSPLFSHHFQWISLNNCNLTECRFADLGENPIYPNSLYLAHNQISDASVITSMYGNWGENTIYYLDLSWNPLTNLGDVPSSFGDFDPLFDSDANSVGLDLSGTSFEGEYDFGWIND